MITDITHATKVFKEWHLKLGHIGKATQILMMPEGIPSIDKKVMRKIDTHCQVCATMKSTRMSYRKKVGSRDPNPMSTLHADTKGDMKYPGQYGTTSNIRYWLGVKDDCTSMTWIYLFKSKTEVPELLKDLIALIETQHGTKVTRLRSDGGTEFVNKSMNKFYKEKGIRAQKSNSYYHEENGAAERDNRTKLEGIRCALETAQMKVKWWPEALMYKNYVQVRTPIARLNWISPYEKTHNVPPDLSNLRPWGSVCYAHIPEEKRKHKSLPARAVRCRFLGISEEYKGYRLYDETNNKFIISRDVIFHKDYIHEMLKRAFENKAQPLSTKEKEKVHQLGLDTPVQTDDNKLDVQSDEMDDLEDVLDNYEYKKAVGVLPLRSEKHPRVFPNTKSVGADFPVISKSYKRKVKFISTDSESDSSQQSHQQDILINAKILPVPTPLV